MRPVQTCKDQLGFDSIPRFGCNSSQFRTTTSGTYLGLNFGESDDFAASDPFKCLDFQTRYMCNGAWTAWRGSPATATGDDESRERYKSTWGLCDSPTDIQARRTQPIPGAPHGDPINGPRDRLRQYAVRFICN